MSSGVGDSKIFAAPEGSFPAGEQLTVNGKPIPAEFAHAVPFANTDQGRKLMAEGGVIADQEGSRVQVTAAAEDKARVGRARGDRSAPKIDPRIKGLQFDQAIAARRSDNLQPWQTPDPMADLTDEHLPDGFKARFLSDKVIKRRGMRGFQPVIDEKTGQPVRMADMIMGAMPADMASQRNEHYRREGEIRQQAAVDEFNEGHDRMMHEARKQGVQLSPLSPGGAISGFSPNGQGGYAGGAASIGLHQQRGNDGEEILMED